MLEPAPERLVAWPPRSGKVAIVGGTKAPPAAGEADGSRPLLVCLLAVRNGAAELADYLESAGRFADAVIALDDGSSDATAELLAASPLVARVIRNPARDSYAGWDDAANRQALLDACARARPALGRLPRRRRADRPRRRGAPCANSPPARPCRARRTAFASTG